MDLKATASTVCTKSEVNKFLSQKASVSDVNAKMNTVDAYTKTEINNLLLTKTDDAEVYPAIDQKRILAIRTLTLKTATFLHAKADTNTMTGFLNLNADATNVHIKVESEQKKQGKQT